MIVGLCRVELRVPMSQSLKNKRGVLKSMINRIKNRFNVSISEVAKHDDLKLASLGIVTVSCDRIYVEKLLNKVLDYIESNYIEVQLLDESIEFI
ncbi:DUF503 domain-containing protein [Orenia marismortui]|uniref:DUF503 domain-containing protein n=1 Tax=Orenia marismortui TaxID=46469 RepID=UPI0003605DA1|nr:DUF503 domain-containing protein [Orenia marismortui]